MTPELTVQEFLLMIWIIKIIQIHCSHQSHFQCRYSFLAICIKKCDIAKKNVVCTRKFKKKLRKFHYPELIVTLKVHAFNIKLITHTKLLFIPLLFQQCMTSLSVRTNLGESRLIRESVFLFPFWLNFENRTRLQAGQGRLLWGGGRTGSIWGKNGPTKAKQGRVGPNEGGVGVQRLGGRWGTAWERCGIAFRGSGAYSVLAWHTKDPSRSRLGYYYLYPLINTNSRSIIFILYRDGDQISNQENLSVSRDHANKKLL